MNINIIKNDILWDELSAKEHLKIFSKIKGIPPRYEHYMMSKCMNDVGMNDESKHLNSNNNNNSIDNSIIDSNANVSMRREKLESYKKCDSTKLVKNMSGGEKRRLSLALSLLGNPKIIILDEPTVINNYNTKMKN